MRNNVIDKTYYGIYALRLTQLMIFAGGKTEATRDVIVAAGCVLPHVLSLRPAEVRVREAISQPNTKITAISRHPRTQSSTPKLEHLQYRVNRAVSLFSSSLSAQLVIGEFRIVMKSFSVMFQTRNGFLN